MRKLPDQPDNQKRSTAEQQPGFCWAVVFGDYEPAKIDMLFATKALAEKRADQLGRDWRAERWAIQGWHVEPHVYARDIHSGAGNCVCGWALGSSKHVQAAPGVPIPDQLRLAT